MNDLLIKTALVEEMKETIRQTRLNLELKEILEAHLEFIVRYCEETGIPLPDVATVTNFIQKEKFIVEQMRPRDLKHAGETRADGREPGILEFTSHRRRS